jgi:hypothetical protein
MPILVLSFKFTYDFFLSCLVVDTTGLLVPFTVIFKCLYYIFSVTFRPISLKLQEFNSSTSTTLFCHGTPSSNLRSVTSFPQVPPPPIPPSVCETSSFSGFNSLSPSHGLTIPTLFKFTSSPLPRFNVYTQLNKQQNQKHPQCVIMGQGHSPVYQP